MTLMLGAVGVVTWLVQADEVRARHFAAAGLWLLTSALGVSGWQRTPSGQLTWDTQAWQWQASDQAWPVSVEVALDFQSWVLLRLHGTASGRVLWVWPERGSAPLNWRALRRALVAHQGQTGQSGGLDTIEPSPG